MRGRPFHPNILYSFQISISVCICKSACLLLQQLNMADSKNYRTFCVSWAKSLKHASKLMQEFAADEVWQTAVWILDFSPYTSFIYGTLIKKKEKFSSYIRNSEGIGCEVIYKEGLPNIWRNAQIFNHIWGLRRPLVMYDFATDPIWTSLYMKKIWFSFLSV